MKKPHNPFVVVSTFCGGIGIVLSFLATACWKDGHSYMGFGYQLGDAIWKLGFPLTAWGMLFNRVLPPLTEADDAWAVPALSACMVLQWVLWGLLVSWIWRRIKESKHVKSNKRRAAYEGSEDNRNR